MYKPGISLEVKQPLVLVFPSRQLCAASSYASIYKVWEAIPCWANLANPLWLSIFGSERLLLTSPPPPYLYCLIQRYLSLQGLQCLLEVGSSSATDQTGSPGFRRLPVVSTRPGAASSFCHWIPLLAPLLHPAPCPDGPACSLSHLSNFLQTSLPLSTPETNVLQQCCK